MSMGLLRYWAYNGSTCAFADEKTMSTEADRSKSLLIICFVVAGSFHCFDHNRYRGHLVFIYCFKVR